MFQEPSNHKKISKIKFPCRSQYNTLYRGTITDDTKNELVFYGEFQR